MRGRGQAGAIASRGRGRQGAGQVGEVAALCGASQVGGAGQVRGGGRV